MIGRFNVRSMYREDKRSAFMIGVADMRFLNMGHVYEIRGDELTGFEIIDLGLSVASGNPKLDSTMMSIDKFLVLAAGDHLLPKSPKKQEGMIARFHVRSMGREDPSAFIIGVADMQYLNQNHVYEIQETVSHKKLKDLGESLFVEGSNASSLDVFLVKSAGNHLIPKYNKEI